MLSKYYSPDITEGATPSLRKKDYTPEADSDFSTVAKKVSDAWEANPGITLLWKTQAQFAAMVAGFDADYGTDLSTGSGRPSISATLRNLDKQIDIGVTEIKVYIQKKFKSPNGPPEYPRYGIVHTSKGGYRFPADRDQRKNNLDLMLAAIVADGFGAEPYGTAYWADIKTNYLAALASATTVDGTVSTSASSKNNQKKAISKVMTALRSVLRGNYPDTYKAVYRDWGWQKEDY